MRGQLTEVRNPLTPYVYCQCLGPRLDLLAPFNRQGSKYPTRQSLKRLFEPLAILDFLQMPTLRNRQFPGLDRPTVHERMTELDVFGI